MQNHPSEVTCTKVFEVFGDRWILKIVDTLRKEPLRFVQIQKQIGINSATLVIKLKRLEDLKILNRIEKSCDKQSVAYSLTDLGGLLVPVIDSILAFGNKLQ